MRKFSGDTLVLATHNIGKVAELAALLRPFGVKVLSAADFGLVAPEETEDSFAGNARLKAHVVSMATGLPALSDDSGLEVDALGGAPGVHTADWAEGPGGRDFLMAMKKTWDLVQRSGVDGPFCARFRCALVLAWPDGHDEVFEGKVEGHVVWPIRGDLGHGFDPMFQPLGDSRTFAEIHPTEKNTVSHRAEAFGLLRSQCFT